MEYSEKVRFLAFLVFLFAGLLCSAQDPAPPTATKTGDFFSGIITAFSKTELTVYRKGFGKETTVTKTFVVDGNTRVEGALKVKAHVTVRFIPGENETHAVHIIVR